MLLFWNGNFFCTAVNARCLIDVITALKIAPLSRCPSFEFFETKQLLLRYLFELVAILSLKLDRCLQFDTIAAHHLYDLVTVLLFQSALIRDLVNALFWRSKFGRNSAKNQPLIFVLHFLNLKYR